jgi:hypothetical protein
MLLLDARRYDMTGSVGMWATPGRLSREPGMTASNRDAAPEDQRTVPIPCPSCHARGYLIGDVEIGPYGYVQEIVGRCESCEGRGRIFLSTDQQERAVSASESR